MSQLGRAPARHGAGSGRGDLLALRADFRDSGLAHLLAVSGQNVMLLAALAAAPLSAAGLGPRARAAALLWLILAYVPLAGAGPSLQRAGVMGAAGVAATTMSRPSSCWYALILAAAAARPQPARLRRAAGGCPSQRWRASSPLGRPLRDPDCAAVPCGAALTWRAHSERRRRWPRRGIAITLAATLATAPRSPPPLRLGAIDRPAREPARAARGRPCHVGWSRPRSGRRRRRPPPVGWLASALGPLADLPVAYLAALAERLGGPRSHQLSPPLGGTLAVTGAYGALAIAAAAALRAAALGPRAEELAALPGGGAGAATASVWAPRRWSQWSWAASGCWGRLHRPTLTVRFWTSAKGTTPHRQRPDGAAVLFDGGPPEAGVVRLLRGAGVRRPLSAVVATRLTRPSRRAARGARALSGRRAARRR